MGLVDDAWNVVLVAGLLVSFGWLAAFFIHIINKGE